MYSLYDSLISQHPKQLTPLRCAPSTISQLHRYFEDVVLENHLSALVVEGLPLCTERTIREIARVRDLDKTSYGLFLTLNKDDDLIIALGDREKRNSKSIIWHSTDHDRLNDRFLVIADAHFSAVIASVSNPNEDCQEQRQQVVWTFEPDIVYSALEYLMARVTAEHPHDASAFAEAVRLSTPKETSLQLALGVTTKLTQLLQEQAEREIAVNRIAAALQNCLNLDELILTSVNEIGRVLKVKCCAIRVEGKFPGRALTKYYFDSEEKPEESELANYLGDLETLSIRTSHALRVDIVDGDHPRGGASICHVVIPLLYKRVFAGVLLVRSDDPSHVWEEGQLLLLNTVADQLALAVNQAHLYEEIQQQALTDTLTGWHNRRSFELQLERDLHLATRMRQPLSLIMMDLDNFTEINNAAGHETGDMALRMLAETLRVELRAVDTAARYGGDEFAIILPQANSEGALVVAERLRKRISETSVPGYGPMSASLGLATFPLHASSRDTLIVAADRALYEAKYAGRNRVSVPADDCDDYADVPEKAVTLDLRNPLS
jgi:diguanylate cyclase (GGDEF)-like protein